MSIMKDDSGRRWVQVEVEVPGTPEIVGSAVASGPGISSWFVPTTFEADETGKPIRITSNFGPGMDSVSTVTTWNPSYLLGAVSEDLGPAAPPIDTEWTVEEKDTGHCITRVVHRITTDSDQWDKPLESWEQGWPHFFRPLKLYLTYYSGLLCSAFQVMGAAPAPKIKAWDALISALGIPPATAGDRCSTSDSVPQLGGIVEGIGKASHPEELLMRLDQPAPGIAHLFAMPMGNQIILSLRVFLYGDHAAAAGASDEPHWQVWMSERFPMSAPA